MRHSSNWISFDWVKVGIYGTVRYEIVICYELIIKDVSEGNSCIKRKIFFTFNNLKVKISNFVHEG